MSFEGRDEERSIGNFLGGVFITRCVCVCVCARAWVEREREKERGDLREKAKEVGEGERARGVVAWVM